MIYPGFIGASDTLRARTVNAERTINWYPEIATGTPKSKTWLAPTPGLAPFVVLEAGPVRALFSEEGRCFAVGGATLYEITATPTVIARGTVGLDAYPASISSNGSDGHQLFIVSAGNGFIFDLDANTLTALDVATAPDFPRPCRMGAFVDGYFLALQSNSDRFQISALEDGLVWDPLDVAQVSQTTGIVRALVPVHREVWLLGTSKTTVWADVGDPDFPFAPIPGAFIEQGIGSFFGWTVIDNALFWHGHTDDGGRVVYRAQGYQPQRISTHAVEQVWTALATVQDAIAWSYQDQGHTFVCFYLPSAETTWVFDGATQTWHERSVWDPTALAWTPHLGRAHTYSFDRHLVGDRQSGAVYEMNTTFYDDGRPREEGADLMLLFLDGMAHYDTSRIAAKYTTVNTSVATWAVMAEGRFGNCLKRVATSNAAFPGYLSIAPLTTRLGVWTPTTSGVCGFAIKVDDLAVLDAFALSPSASLLKIVEGAGYHLRLNLNVDGTFSLIQNIGSGEGSSGAHILAQSSEGLNSGTWMYVECRWVIHPTAGAFDVRVNGVTVLTYTGVTTENEFGFNSLGIWNAVHLLELRASTSTPPLLTVRMCDLYLADLAFATADDVHDFLGDGTIVTILPNAVGSTTGWTPSAGANWDATNDRPAPDDDATYVATLTPGTRDTYNYEDIPPDALVKGAQVNILARKETEGSAAVAPVVHQGATDYLGPTQGVATVLYDHYITQAYDLNPATGVKFTATEINAGEFGVQKVT